MKAEPVALGTSLVTASNADMPPRERLVYLPLLTTCHSSFESLVLVTWGVSMEFLPTMGLQE